VAAKRRRVPLSTCFLALQDYAYASLVSSLLLPPYPVASFLDVAI
jgi:hypothetical protein